MTALAPYLSSFLREHLPKERRASQHTCESYAQAFQLLLCFASRRLKVKPAKIEIERLDAPLILAFLEHLERTRANSARTRNVRLAAVNAFFRFLEYRLPSCLDQARRIHAIPMKKTDQALVGYLTRDELQALLDAPDPKTVFGIRDRAMLHLAFAAGLRVSELVNLQLDQIDPPTLSTVHIIGKGRRERILPLWKETAAAIKAWLQVRPSGSASELFLNTRAQAMTRSGFEYILAKHVAKAAYEVPSIAAKSVSPHVLRHYVSFLTMSGNSEAPADLIGNVGSSRAQVLPITQHSFGRIQESNWRSVACRDTGAYSIDFRK
jgi:integrase/recombinase XerD